MHLIILSTYAEVCLFMLTTFVVALLIGKAKNSF